MMHIAVRHGDSSWPTGSVDEVVDELRSPTRAQRAAASTIAAAVGASHYDPKTWVMSFEHGPGESNTDLDDLHPGIASPFSAVDRQAGQKLLFLAWRAGSPPPAAWWE